MKPPLRQMRNSPRTGLLRSQASNSGVLRRTISEGTGASSAAAEIQSSNIRVAVRVRPLNGRESSTK